MNQPRQNMNPPAAPSTGAPSADPSQDRSGPDNTASPEAGEADPPLQGEGNYTAARRHRKSVKKFVESGQVEPAAREAEPASAEEERDLKAAEDKGRSHARK